VKHVDLVACKDVELCGDERGAGLLICFIVIDADSVVAQPTERHVSAHAIGGDLSPLPDDAAQSFWLL